VIATGLRRLRSFRPRDAVGGFSFRGRGSGIAAYTEESSPSAISIEQGMSVSTVYACVRILADTVGSTPLITYRTDAHGNRARTHDKAWSLIHDRPNPVQTSVDMWSVIASWLVGWGDAFVGKQMKAGELIALWPIHPREVTVSLVNGVPRYQVGANEYGVEEVIHVMGQSFDGLRGVSPLTILRNELGNALAAQQYARSMYTNSAVPRGALKVKRELSDEAINRLRGDWERTYGGPARAGRVAILEDGSEFQPISMPLTDLQFVQQQQLSVQVIARAFRVPLSLIQADSPGGLTYRTAETENLQFLTHSVRPWYVRIEQALTSDLDLFPVEGEYAEFLPDALLRVTTLERFQAYQIATGHKPWMRSSEVRIAENLPYDPMIDLEPAAGTSAVTQGLDDLEEVQRD
jgi:HK97 family phage portal protein